MQLIEDKDTTELITALLNDETADNSKFELQQKDLKITIRKTDLIKEQTLKRAYTNLNEERVAN